MIRWKLATGVREADSMTAIMLDIQRSLMQQTVRSGEDHPAEPLVERLLRMPCGQTLALAYVQHAKSGMGADMINLIARAGARRDYAIQVVTAGLGSETIAVRSEAVDAAVAFDYQEMVDLLQVHSRHEPEGWLAEYAFRCSQRIGRKQG